MRTTIYSIALWWISCTWAQAATLTGAVLNDKGQPAAGATIIAAAIFHSPPLRRTAMADQNGAFQIDLPPQSGSQRYMLAVRWQGQGINLTDALDANGEATGIRGQILPSQTIRLRPGGKFHGRLLQAENDAPIAGAQLFLDTGEVLTTEP